MPTSAFPYKSPTICFHFVHAFISAALCLIKCTFVRLTKGSQRGTSHFEHLLSLLLVDRNKRRELNVIYVFSILLQSVLDLNLRVNLTLCFDHRRLSLLLVLDGDIVNWNSSFVHLLHYGRWVRHELDSFEPISQ